MADKHDRHFNVAISLHIDDNHGLMELIENSEPGKNLLENSQGLRRTLEEIRQTGNIDEMIDAEIELLLDQINAAIGREPPWPVELQSIAKADEEMARGLRCYDQLSEDVEAYKADTAFHGKIAMDNYPHDSFRIFLEGQHARLQNALKMPYSEAERTVLEARDANIKAMTRLYKAMQKERLPEPVREIGELARYRAEKEAAQSAKLDNQHSEPQATETAKKPKRHRLRMK